MTKTTKSAKDDVFSFAPVTDPAQFAETLRTMAEDSMAKTKASFEQAKKALEDMQKDAEANFNTAQERGSKMSKAAIDTVRANTEATLSHMEKLLAVKSVAELLELQTAFVRASAESAVDTAKEMQNLYKDAATEMTADAKAAADKAMKAFKA